jgi:hypothetical protein
VAIGTNFVSLHLNIKNNCAMIQNLKKTLTLAVKSFYSYRFDKIQVILESIDCSLLDKAQLSEFLKFQKLFFLGQLLGLPTLHAILAVHGIQSNQTQKNIIFYVNH